MHEVAHADRSGVPFQVEHWCHRAPDADKGQPLVNFVEGGTDRFKLAAEGGSQL